MFIYDSEQDLIRSVREHTQGKIDQLTGEIQKEIAKERQKRMVRKSQQHMLLVARRAAYGDVLYMLTDYELRNKTAE